MPGISVIIPVYNAEKYLHRCIDSIISQTYTDCELLLIDDGSTDSSGAICDKYAARDKRVRVFHKENAGVSSARNLGLDNASGDWICFCDADDTMPPNSLSQLLNPNYDFIIGSFYWNLEECFLDIDEGQGENLSRCIARNKMKMHLSVVWGSLYRREIIERNHIRFDLRFNSGEDTLFVYTYLRYIKSILFSPELVYEYHKKQNEGLSSILKLDWAQHHTLLLEIHNAYSELENRFQIPFTDSYLIDCMNQLNKCMPALCNTSLGSCREVMQLIVDDSLMMGLWSEKKYISKGMRRRLFDLFALHRCYSILTLYIKCIGYKY